MTDVLPPLNSQFSILNSPFSISGRVARLADGREFPLDTLTDFGFLVLEEGRFAIARLFRAPDGTRLLADARAFAGTPAAAFERLWHGHFRRNFFLVGMEETEFHATAGLRETVFSACAERAARLAAPAPNARNLQLGHFEETPDGLRRILPRGESPKIPPLNVCPCPVPPGQASAPDLFIADNLEPTLFRACLGVWLLSRDPAAAR